MIADALHDISRHFHIKKCNGQVHQLDEEIRSQRDVDAGTEMQEYPSADEFNADSPEK